MTRSRPIVLLAVLSLIWGSSFMFIKVAVRQLDPSTLILGRLGLATLTLLVVVPWLVGRGVAWADFRAHWQWLVVVGLLNTAAPFWLLSWGETRIDSGLASIIQASVPIFNALLAFGIFHEERVTGTRLLGVAVGFVGVAILLGAQPHAKLLGALAVVGMALCYAAGGLLTKRHLGTARPQVIALGTAAVAAVAVLPAGVAQAPSHVPGWKELASVVVLGTVCTAVAYLLFFTIIARAGAGYAALVTYLVPPVALFYGAVFLGEGIGWPALVGLVLILGGVSLGTGGRHGCGAGRRPPRRRREYGRTEACMEVTIRRATAEDADWIAALVGDAETEPFLSGRGAFDRDAILAEIERSQREPERFGRFVVEVDGGRAGVMGFSERSETHRIAQLGGLAIHPDHRGRRVADDAARQLQRLLLVELGYHRLELACYGFNERAIRHAERVGFVREGVQRRAYFRHGEWQDAVLFSLLREDLGEC